MQERHKQSGWAKRNRLRGVLFAACLRFGMEVTMRKSGILLPVSSLPSPYGIGAFGKEAYEFVDFLKEAGQSLWQILPLGPTGYGDSPYQSFSTFAGNHYLIDLQAFIEKGWLDQEACSAMDMGGSQAYVDYEKIYQNKNRLLRLAYERSGIRENGEFHQFCRENGFWLEDYALYMAIKKEQGGKSWIEWEEDVKLRRHDAMERCRQTLWQEMEYEKFLQFSFAVQWSALKRYANEKGIRIVGDIPIYVALDGSDVWAHPELFRLKENGEPEAVAGCPPDAFSATGQLWGNPLYRWEYHRQTGYDWWMRRIAYCYRLYDVLRIDHFRGFEAYYAIPYGDKTAEGGHWEKGPDYDFFAVLKQRLGNPDVIAEDLGFLTKEVLDMVEKTGYPGMKVLQFAFHNWEDNAYLPHNYPKNCVVYTGTHDNQTTKGWFAELSKEDKEYVKTYLHTRRPQDIPRALIRAAMASVADTAIIPIQDWLGLGQEARMNLPSTLGDNWKWRLVKGQCSEALAKEIKEMTVLYGRG